MTFGLPLSIRLYWFNSFCRTDSTEVSLLRSRYFLLWNDRIKKGRGRVVKVTDLTWLLVFSSLEQLDRNVKSENPSLFPQFLVSHSDLPSLFYGVDVYMFLLPLITNDHRRRISKCKEKSNLNILRKLYLNMVNVNSLEYKSI